MTRNQYKTRNAVSLPLFFLVVVLSVCGPGCATANDLLCPRNFLYCKYILCRVARPGWCINPLRRREIPMASARFSQRDAYGSAPVWHSLQFISFQASSISTGCLNSRSFRDTAISSPLPWLMMMWHALQSLLMTSPPNALANS